MRKLILILICLNLFVLTNAQIDSCFKFLKLSEWNINVCLPKNGYVDDVTGSDLLIGRYMTDENDIEITIFKEKIFNNEPILDLYHKHFKNNNTTFQKDTLFNDSKKEVYLVFKDSTKKIFLNGVFIISNNCYFVNSSKINKSENNFYIIIDIIKSIYPNLSNNDDNDVIQKNSKELLKNLFEQKLLLEDFLLSEKVIESLKSGSFYDTFRNDKVNFLGYLNKRNENIRNEFQIIKVLEKPTNIEIKLNQDKSVSEGLAYNVEMKITYAKGTFPAKIYIIIIDEKPYIVGMKIE